MLIENPSGWTSQLPIKGNPLVSIVVPSYNRPKQLNILIQSLLLQTYQNVEIIVYNDGPNSEIRDLLSDYQNESRVIYLETAEHMGGWGHLQRELGSKVAKGDFIGHANDDNYYCPVYIEWMVAALVNLGSDFAFCNFVHSHEGYKPFDTYPALGKIDAGVWIAKSNLVKETPWPNYSFSADGQYVEELLKKNPKVTKIPGYLVIHN